MENNSAPNARWLQYVIYWQAYTRVLLMVFLIRVRTQPLPPALET